MRLLIFFSLVLSSCNFNENKYHKALNHFEGDTLKSKAISFLVENIGDQHSVVYRYRNEKGEVVDEELKRYMGDDPDFFLDSIGALLELEEQMDSLVVSSDYLINEVENAFSFYENNLLGLKVDEDVFLNYILPYRVGTEELNDWRVYFNKRYTKHLKSFNRKYELKPLLQAINNEKNPWYGLYGRLKRTQFQFSPNFTHQQMLDLKWVRDCEDYAIHYLYVFRSLGIPAAYEVIPLWGKFNYGHSETAIMDKDGVFYPARVSDNEPFKYQIAKMYRRKFGKVDNPYERIKRIGVEEKDIPQYFNQRNLTDITHERTEVGNIRIKLDKSKIVEQVTYLCVYNEGWWKPVEWSQVDISNEYSFKDMGRKILYHHATFKDGEVRLLGMPIILDTLGNQRTLNRNGNKLVVDISNFDRNSRLTEDNEYRVFEWSEVNKNWVKLGLKKCVDGIIQQDKVSESSLLKVEPLNGNYAPVRPFTIVNNKQIWW